MELLYTDGMRYKARMPTLASTSQWLVRQNNQEQNKDKRSLLLGFHINNTGDVFEHSFKPRNALHKICPSITLGNEKKLFF